MEYIEDDLYGFIIGNGLDPICYKNLNDCGYTYETLKYIENDDLICIFPDRKDTALRSEFRAKLFSWKAKNDVCVSRSVQSISLPTQNASHEINIERDLTFRKSASDILQSSQIGRQIVQEYNIVKTLSQETRRKIVSLISENFYKPHDDSYASVKLAEIEKLANEIVHIFPSENRGIYYLGRKETKRCSPGGILYNKLHNHYTKRSGKIQIIPSVPVNNDNFVVCTDMLDTLQKLKYYIGCEEDCLELWNFTFEYRKEFISSPLNNIEAVIREFPLLKQATGYKFVEQDFIKLYPDRQYCLTTKWEETVPKLIKHYKTYVKDKFYKGLFLSITDSVDPNSKDCVVFVLLHAVIKPSHRFSVRRDDQTFFRKASIQDGISSCILQVDAINDLHNQLELLHRKSIENNTPIQPFIIVVGSDLLNLAEFYVSFGEHLYKFNSFIIALDICFKIYQVFCLKYPSQSQKVWTFLQEFFYDIKTMYDKHYSCVANVIQSISN